MTLMAVVAYLVVVTLWIYGVMDRSIVSDSIAVALIMLVVAVHPASGFFAGRWWAPFVPLAAVVIAVPAGYPPINPDAAEPLPLWFDIATAEVIAVPLVLLGVLPIAFGSTVL